MNPVLAAGQIEGGVAQAWAMPSTKKLSGKTAA